jgi:hypothetical protein
LHSAEDEVEYRTEEGFKIFGGIRDASPDGWGRHVLERENNRLNYNGNRTVADIQRFVQNNAH